MLRPTQVLDVRPRLVLALRTRRPESRVRAEQGGRTVRREPDVDECRTVRRSRSLSLGSSCVSILGFSRFSGSLWERGTLKPRLLTRGHRAQKLWLPCLFRFNFASRLPVRSGSTVNTSRNATDGLPDQQTPFAPRNMLYEASKSQNRFDTIKYCDQEDPQNRESVAFPICVACRSLRHVRVPGYQRRRERFCVYIEKSVA